MNLYSSPFFILTVAIGTVSYTHLDVYKRQVHALHVCTLGQQVVLCCVGVSRGVEVVHGGVCQIVGQVGVHQRAGGGHSAGKQLAHTVDAGLAHIADPHGGVNAVVLAAAYKPNPISRAGQFYTTNPIRLFSVELFHTCRFTAHVFFNAH